jgi:hypothetical protein
MKLTRSAANKGRGETTAVAEADLGPRQFRWSVSEKVVKFVVTGSNRPQGGEYNWGNVLALSELSNALQAGIVLGGSLRQTIELELVKLLEVAIRTAEEPSLVKGSPSAIRVKRLATGAGALPRPVAVREDDAA